MIKLSKNDIKELKGIGKDLLMLIFYAIPIVFSFLVGYCVCCASNNLKIPFL